MNFWPKVFLAILSTWRVTHLVVHEDGPWDLIARLRKVLGSSWLGQLMDCFYCLSLWVAAPAALFVCGSRLEILFVWLAVSGGACILERIGPPSVFMPSSIESAPESREDNPRQDTLQS